VNRLLGAFQEKAMASEGESRLVKPESARNKEMISQSLLSFLMFEWKNCQFCFFMSHMLSSNFAATAKDAS